MSVSSAEVDTLIRQAFDLLIQIRHQREAARSLALANAFLNMLARNPNQEAPSVVISLKAVPIHENRGGPASRGESRRES